MLISTPANDGVSEVLQKDNMGDKRSRRETRELLVTLTLTS